MAGFFFVHWGLITYLYLIIIYISLLYLITYFLLCLLWLQKILKRDQNIDKHTDNYSYMF